MHCFGLLYTIYVNPSFREIVMITVHVKRNSMDVYLVLDL